MDVLLAVPRDAALLGISVPRHNVHKSVHKWQRNGPRRYLRGPFCTSSGDRIRTCDLWVMS